MGGDFAEAEDGEGCLGTMVFNIWRMASSLEAMEVWAAVSLAMASSRWSKVWCLPLKSGRMDQLLAVVPLSLRLREVSK